MFHSGDVNFFRLFHGMLENQEDLWYNKDKLFLGRVPNEAH